MKRLVPVLTALSLLSGFATAAPAQVAVYTTQASFDAANPGATFYDFQAFPDDGSFNPTFTNGPLAFAGPAMRLFDDGGFGDGVHYLNEFDGPATVTVAGGVFAISFTLGTYYGARTIDFEVNGAPAASLSLAAGHPTTGFIGFSSVEPITSLSFNNATVAGDEIDFVNFQAGGAVPEPTTYALLAAGGLGLVARGRRRPRPRTV